MTRDTILLALLASNGNPVRVRSTKQSGSEATILGLYAGKVALAYPSGGSGWYRFDDSPMSILDFELVDPSILERVRFERLGEEADS